MTRKMLAFRMGEKSEGKAPGRNGGTRSGGCTKRYLSFCDAERGVFENHFWEVLADPERFRLPDKLAVNQ